MKLTKTQQKQRILMMLFGAFAIFFTGYPHVWSIYQPYVMEQAGWTGGAGISLFLSGTFILCVWKHCGRKDAG